MMPVRVPMSALHMSYAPCLTDVVVSEAHGHEVLGRPEVIHLMTPGMGSKVDWLNHHPI